MPKFMDTVPKKIFIPDSVTLPKCMNRVPINLWGSCSMLETVNILSCPTSNTKLKENRALVKKKGGLSYPFKKQNRQPNHWLPFSIFGFLVLNKYFYFLFCLRFAI